MLEHKGNLEGFKIAFIGDGNNMVHSWMESGRKIADQFIVACPKGYEANKAIEEKAGRNGARVTVTHSVEEATSGADVIYTDVWASMGKEEEAEGRIEAFGRIIRSTKTWSQWRKRMPS